MSEDNHKQGPVRQREIKPRTEAAKKSGSQAGKPKPGPSGPPSKPRKKQGKKGRGGSQRSSAGQDKDRRQAEGPKQQQARRPAEAGEGRKKEEAAQPRPPRTDSQERKQKSGRKRRSSRKFARQEGSQFRGEETAADVARDITRIEKDIQIDLDSIRNQKLDL